MMEPVKVMVPLPWSAAWEAEVVPNAIKVAMASALSFMFSPLMFCF
jgi:hypothetical protein